VRDAVIAAPWVRGAEEWLRGNPYAQRFVLVSATPQGELDDIVTALQLRSCFSAVFGTPTSKTEAVQRSLLDYAVAAHDAVFIGDAVADRDAAAAAGVPFVLRRHSSNGTVDAGRDAMSVRDLTEL